MEGSSSKHDLDVSEDKKAADIKRPKLDDEETKAIPSREQRLEWFMSLFKNREELEAAYKEDESDSEDGTHSLTFRDLASFELDMYESGVSYYILSIPPLIHFIIIIVCVFATFVLCLLVLSLYTD